MEKMRMHRSLQAVDQVDTLDFGSFVSIFFFVFLLVVFSTILSPIEAFAHKLIVFAWASNDTISVESSLSGGRHLVKCNVAVKNNLTNEVITEGVTDSSGIFSIPLSKNLQEKPVDLRIIVSTDDGHRAEWLMEQSEYGASLAVASTSPPQVKTDNQLASDREQKCLSKEELTSMMDASLEKKLAPLRRQIARINHEKKPTLSDILGGIGYLIGLAGLAAWLKSKS